MAKEKKPTAAKASRVANAHNALKTAAECIGPVEKGMAVFAITRGQISMIDVVSHLISQMERPQISVWTWCIADYEVEAFEKLLRDDRLSGGRLIIDQRGEQRNVDLVDRWRAKFGPESVKVCMNHAKIATLCDANYRVLARGSMNLNHNPRFEQFDVSEGDDAYSLVQEIENELPILPRLCTWREAEEASGVRESWTMDDLKPFQLSGVKVWAK
jgi:hypothetical protein